MKASIKLLCMTWLIWSGQSKANNVQINHVMITDQQHISFDLSWDHSWHLPANNAPGNHDAVWVFAKYRQTSGIWQHINLSALNSDHTVSDNLLEIQAVQDQKGVFVRRASVGQGPIPSVNVTLELAQALPSGYYDLKVMGVEMVYITPGSFMIGDSVSNHTLKTGNNAPFNVQSEDEIVIGLAANQLHPGDSNAISGVVPGAFPKGYGGFYCMKYEISQQQYADFLNTLTFTQQELRTERSPASAPGTYAMAVTQAGNNRNGIAVEQAGQDPDIPAQYSCEWNADQIFNSGDDAQNRACNYLSWADLLAYFDWSGLRPMTELEFEKACRGPEQVIRKGFAWNTPYIVDANTLQMDGTDQETVAEKGNDSVGVGSHGYFGPQGPIRTGFAAHDSSTRVTSGAGYYGVMEMSGNLWEQCVVVNSVGFEFNGQHGDGQLTQAGEANTSFWYPDGSNSGYRGGAWFSGILPNFRDLAVSDRYYIGRQLSSILRRHTSGGRGVRTFNQ